MISRRAAVLIAGLLATIALIATTPRSAAFAGPAPFDLAGPTIEVKVTRGTVTLPISAVPNLAAGDHLWIKADLPPSQSAHYLLIVAFLNGATNPPPKNWFYRCETWSDDCARDGLKVSVPADSQQVLVFLAPETGGDYRTLVNAVRGRPGAFVRTSQDLNQAALDRSRLEAYLQAIRTLDADEPAKLKDVAPLLARSLAIKVDDKCLDRIAPLQAPCLMQGQESLILNDGHSTSIVEALTSGPASDLAMEASYTPQLSYGYYSPYVASVLDIARLLDPFRTAQYQYIPALATARDDRLVLTLNTAPSFYNPKSVLVIALPAVEKSQYPPLHAVAPDEAYCAQKSRLVLPVEGAPLVFSAAYAHTMSLQLTARDGKSIELPAKADATQGGFVIDTSALDKIQLSEASTGKLHGRWGFDPYEGPSFHLVSAHTESWVPVVMGQNALIVGRPATIRLQASNVSCIESIALKNPGGKDLKLDWRPLKTNEVELQLPLENAEPGPVTLLVSQYGAAQPQPVLLQSFAEASHLDHFTVHAGDSEGILQGTRLDQVASLTLGNVSFLPEKLLSHDGSDELSMTVADPATLTGLKADTSVIARIALKDGRMTKLNVTVAAARPSVSLLNKSVRPSPSSIDSNIQLAGQDELPQDATLIFSLRTHSPQRFQRDETIEIATDDESYSTYLSFMNGGLTLEDAAVAVATVNPEKAFGLSAFGPLKFRVTANGITGEWQPLATLVRLPVLKELHCPATPELACKLSGANLFLVESLANDPHFTKPVRVPDGFPGLALPVPHPTDGTLYVKLRDDPKVIHRASLSAEQLPASEDETARAEIRHAATRSDVPTDVPAKPPSAVPATNAAGVPVVTTTAVPSASPSTAPAVAPSPPPAPLPAPAPAPAPTNAAPTKAPQAPSAATAASAASAAAEPAAANH